MAIPAARLGYADPPAHLPDRGSATEPERKASPAAQQASTRLERIINAPTASPPDSHPPAFLSTTKRCKRCGTRGALCDSLGARCLMCGRPVKARDLPKTAQNGHKTRQGPPQDMPPAPVNAVPGKKRGPKPNPNLPYSRYKDPNRIG